jgi:hypothetical protein
MLFKAELSIRIPIAVFLTEHLDALPFLRRSPGAGKRLEEWFCLRRQLYLAVSGTVMYSLASFSGNGRASRLFTDINPLHATLSYLDRLLQRRSSAIDEFSHDSLSLLGTDHPKVVDK